MFKCGPGRYTLYNLKEKVNKTKMSPPPPPPRLCFFFLQLMKDKCLTNTIFLLSAKALINDIFSKFFQVPKP